MHHIVGLKVWFVLVLVLLAGFADPSAEARLFRGRRQRCCRPSPGKTCSPCQSCSPEPCCDPCCCPPRGMAKVCMIDELWGSEGYYIYYAHYHYDGGICPEYEGVIAEAYHQHTVLPEICDACEYVGSRGISRAGLPVPIKTGETLAVYMRTSKATQLDELAGNLKLTDGRTIHARIGVFKVTAKIRESVGGPEKEVTEYFGFGFEAEDTGRDEFHALEIAKHNLGATPQKFLTEFKIGTLKCVVLTVK